MLKPDPNILRLGIPKGSLESATIDLFAKAGWRISIGDRSYFPSIDDPTIEVVLFRPGNVALCGGKRHRRWPDRFGLDTRKRLQCARSV